MLPLADRNSVNATKVPILVFLLLYLINKGDMWYLVLHITLLVRQDRNYRLRLIIVRASIDSRSAHLADIYNLTYARRLSRFQIVVYILYKFDRMFLCYDRFLHKHRVTWSVLERQLVSGAVFGLILE